MSERPLSTDLERLRQLTKPTSEQQLALCRAEAMAGNRRVAFEQAAALATACESPSIVASALAVAGRIDFFYSRIVEGHSRLRRAKVLAVEARDKVLVAEVTAIYVESLLHFVSFDAAASQFPELRRAAVRSGDPKAMFSLHLLLSEGELKSGRSHRAIREIELARACLETCGANKLLHANLEIVHSNLLGMLDDVEGAELHATHAVTLARQVGAINVLQPALNNLGHHQILRGKLAAAALSMESLLGPNSTSVDIDIARRSTHLQLALASDDLALAEAIDSHYAPIAATRESIHAIWYELAHCAYLLRTRRFDEVVQNANRCLRVLEHTGDRTLVDQTRLLLAEAHASAGNTREAANAIVPVALGSLGRVLMSFAATERVLGLIAQPTLHAASHYKRAARVFAGVGNLVARGVALHDLANLKHRDSRNAELSPVPSVTTFYSSTKGYGRIETLRPESAADAVALATDATAALVDLMSRPSLAGYELLLLAQAGSACNRSIFVASGGVEQEVLGWAGSDVPDQSLLAARDDAISFDLGDENGRRHTLIVRPANDTTALVTLLSLQRLVVAAKTLHNALQSESAKSALWPEQLPEQQLGFVCASESMLELLRVTRRTATGNITILIIGDTGTGKELLARAVHQCSPRHRATFLPFNCTAVPKEMLDSQLFGHRRGAFTSAHESSKGIIRSAEGGTLFLDEIGEVGLDLQPKLLRFLEASEVHPLGEPAPVPVDVRVVAATNANLDQMVSDGRFREDLFYRLNVVRLTIPPLRERREEIPLLIDHFMARAQKELGKTGLQLAESTQEFLLLYSWPGNVRELSNEIRRLVAMAESDAVLMPEHLSPKIAATRRTVAVAERPPERNELIVRRDQPLSAAVEHVERTMIQDALRATGSMDLAAKMLGLSRKGLYLKRQRLKIDE